MEYKINLVSEIISENQGPGEIKLSEITSHIFISNTQTSSNLKIILENNINHIFHIGFPLNEKIINQYANKNIKYFFIKITDDNILHYFEKSYQVIHQIIASNKKILFCNDSTNASNVIVIYYLLKRFYLTNFNKNMEQTEKIVDMNKTFVPEIVKFVMENRPCIKMGTNFIHQLLTIEVHMKRFYENQLISELRNKREDNIETEFLDNDTIIKQYFNKLNNPNHEIHNSDNISNDDQVNEEINEDVKEKEIEKEIEKPSIRRRRKPTPKHSSFHRPAISSNLIPNELINEIIHSTLINSEPAHYNNLFSQTNEDNGPRVEEIIESEEINDTAGKLMEIKNNSNEPQRIQLSNESEEENTSIELIDDINDD